MDYKKTILDHPRNKKITFDKDTHTYLYDGKTNFDGITSWIGSYAKPFDREGIASGYKYKIKTTKETVLKLWDFHRDYGNFVHDAIEDYINDGKECELPELEYFKEAMEVHNLTPILGEWIVYDESVKKASAVDCLCVNSDGEYVVVDIKTMKSKLKKSNKRRLSYPLNDLDDCNYNKYSLQVSLYSYWLKNIYGLDLADKNYLLHISHDGWSMIETPNFENKIEQIYEFEDASRN